jgi:Nucleotidyl transferase AbiEii toxin, Type IV TA system
MKARTSPPKSVRILIQWVDQYARSVNQPPGRVHGWVSFMVLAGALERAGFSQQGSPKFAIKGGVALELRLRHLARTTKDLDLILNEERGSLAEELSAALSQPYEGFTFLVKGEPHTMPNGAIRLEVALRYLGKSWDTVPVDISRLEGKATDVELVPAPLLEIFGIRAPESIPCLSLPFHVAQKIHALTEPHTEERPNHRFRDLVDLLLLREWITDFSAVKAACQAVFSQRDAHPWPPFIEVHDHWVVPFGRMAEEVGLYTKDIFQAVLQVRCFLDQIDSAAPLVRHRP